jgi:hypothetical protein
MPKRQFFRLADGRWITAAILIGFLLLLKIASVTLDEPVFELPPFSWFGPMAPYFADLRGVVAGSERLRAGIPPETADLHDPWNRPYNYPRLWLYSDDLGLNAHTVMAFGYGMCILFLISVFFALRKLDTFGGLTSGLFLISYAVMFGLERANVDLLMFVLLALALELRRFPPLAALAITLAAVLKLHPVFAFFAFLAPPWKKTLPWLGAGLLIFTAAILDHFHSFMTAMSYAPNMRTGNLSFGMTALGVDFMERFHRPDAYPEVLMIGLVMLIFAVGIGAWARPSLDSALLGEREIYAFRLGAGIYLGSFLLGTNHDYRAIFLLFCLPLLFQFLKQRVAFGWAWATLILALIYVNWLYLAGEEKWHEYLANQTVAWALVICLTALSVASLPTPLQWPRRFQRNA